MVGSDCLRIQVTCSEFEMIFTRIKYLVSTQPLQSHRPPLSLQSAIMMKCLHTCGGLLRQLLLLVANFLLQMHALSPSVRLEMHQNIFIQYLKFNNFKRVVFIRLIYHGAHTNWGIFKILHDIVQMIR